MARFGSRQTIKGNFLIIFSHAWIQIIFKPQVSKTHFDNSFFAMFLLKTSKKWRVEDLYLQFFFLGRKFFRT